MPRTDNHSDQYFLYNLSCPPNPSPNLLIPQPSCGQPFHLTHVKNCSPVSGAEIWSRGHDHQFFRRSQSRRLVAGRCLFGLPWRYCSNNRAELIDKHSKKNQHTNALALLFSLCPHQCEKHNASYTLAYRLGVISCPFARAWYYLRCVNISQKNHFDNRFPASQSFSFARVFASCTAYKLSMLLHANGQKRS